MNIRLPLSRKENETYLSLFIENIKDYAIFMLDEKGYITSWNKGALYMKGYLAEEIIGKHFSIFYPPEDQNSSKPYWALKIAEREGKYEEEAWRVKRDGSFFWAHVLMTAVFDDNKKLIGFAKITQDLTEKRKMEEELHFMQQCNMELAKSNDDLNEFIHIISHDFKEPLRGISNFTSILAEELKDRLALEERQILDSLQNQARRMSSLVDSLLKIAMAAYVDHMLHTDMNEVVSCVLELLHPLLEERKVEVRIPHPLPTLLCDAIRIREVFINLITNAIKYNNNSQKWIEIGWIEVSSSDLTNPLHPADEKQIALYVKDNGIGIPQKDLNAIFKPFKRLHPKEKHGGGTGIGLSIVRKIIHRHKGKIWVDSKVGEGTTFYFTLSPQEKNGKP